MANGEWSDDTDMMRCVMSAIVEQNGGVDYMSIAAKFKQWAMNGARGMGQTTYNLMMMDDYAERPFEAAELVWRMGRCDNAPNGSVMRTAVVGLLRHDVARHAENIGRLTHFDQRCVGACVVVSELVHALVYEERVLTLADVMALAQQYDERIAAYVEKAAAGICRHWSWTIRFPWGMFSKRWGLRFGPAGMPTVLIRGCRP